MPNHRSGSIVVSVVVAFIVTAIRPAAACCQLGGTTCGDPFAVSCNNGVVCFPPYRSCPDCTCTTTGAGHTCLANTSQPGSVATLFMGPSTQTFGDLDLTWSASCRAPGPDYSVYEGVLGAWYSHASLRCSSGGLLATTVTPSGGDRYYLIAPVAGGLTGSFGTSSAGVERPDGTPSCTDDRALAPCP